MSKWDSSIYFLNSGQSHWQTVDGELFPITWSFIRYKGSLLPFRFFSCTMNGFGMTALGSACSNSMQLSAKKAFAEAWERLWSQKLSAQSKIQISSNGFAAGETSDQATINSRNELLERTIFIQAWSSMRGWKKIDFKKFANRLLAFTLGLRGWKLSLFQVSSNAGTALACLAVHKKLGAVFDIKWVSQSSDGETSLLQSITRSTYGVRHNSSYTDLPLIAKPEDHALFYANPKNLEAFEFLFSSHGERIQQESNDDLIELSHLDFIETKLLVQAGKFPAVAHSINKYWEPLSWGKQSIKGLNPWPHPLA